MKTAVIRLYEGMFLVDSGKAASDWEKMLATIKNVLQRADADVVSIEKWDERNLAYEINKQARGTYILSYFKADSSRVKEIERYSRLSEEIMRVLILSTEKLKMSDESIKKPTPAMIFEQKSKQAKAAKPKSPEETQQPEKPAEPDAKVGETEPETSEAQKNDTDVNDKNDSEKAGLEKNEDKEMKSEESQSDEK